MDHAQSGVFPVGSARRALIIAGASPAATALEEMLRFFGFETRTASAAEEAVRLAAELEPAIGIIDIASPGLSGAELLMRLRANPLLSRCKFVALTHELGRGQAQRRGTDFDALLVTPVSLETLLATLVASGSAVLA